MPQLTIRSLSLMEGYSSDADKKKLVQKLGHIEHRAEDLASDICDHCCRYPKEADAEELPTICEACPAKRLMEMIL